MDTYVARSAKETIVLVDHDVALHSLLALGTSYPDVDLIEKDVLFEGGEHPALRAVTSDEPSFHALNQKRRLATTFGNRVTRNPYRISLPKISCLSVYWMDFHRLAPYKSSVVISGSRGVKSGVPSIVPEVGCRALIAPVSYDQWLLGAVRSLTIPHRCMGIKG